MTRALCHDTHLPPGYQIPRDRGTSKDTTIRYAKYHGRTLATFRGKGARKDAAAFCWEHHHAEQERSRATVGDGGVDDETIARLRAHREEAQGVR